MFDHKLRHKGQKLGAILLLLGGGAASPPVKNSL